MPYTYLAPLGPGDGIVEKDKRRTTHMNLIGPVDAGMSTVIHLLTGKVELVQVHTTDQEMDPDLMVLRGGSPHVVSDDVARVLSEAGLADHLTPIP